jgi:hypothetical protein
MRVGLFSGIGFIRRNGLQRAQTKVLCNSHTKQLIRANYYVQNRVLQFIIFLKEDQNKKRRRART